MLRVSVDKCLSTGEAQRVSQNLGKKPTLNDIIEYFAYCSYPEFRLASMAEEIQALNNRSSVKSWKVPRLKRELEGVSHRRMAMITKCELNKK